MEQEFDLSYLVKSHVIIDHFPLHERDRSQIKVSFHEYKYKLIRGFIYRGFLVNMQPLNFIANYYGEKFGFYFGWLLHYTGQLIIPATLGIIIFLLQTYDKYSTDKPWGDAL